MCPPAEVVGEGGRGSYFFLGGVAAFEDGRRVGAVGVSGLPGEADERLALAAIERTAPGQGRTQTCRVGR
jgi:uncharacterized protein GlcG (DUF336 family)